MIAGLKAGLTLRLAAERTSITTVTLHSWEIRGRKEQERHAAGLPAAWRETNLWSSWMILCARARASMTASAAAARTLPRAQVVAGDVVDAIEGPVVFRGGTQQAQVANDVSGAWFGQGVSGRPADDLRDRSCGGSSGCRRGLIELGQLPRRTNPRTQPTERFGREPTGTRGALGVPQECITRGGGGGKPGG